MPDKHNKDLSIEVLVGLFMFIILIALGVFTIVLSRQNFLQKKYPVTVVFEEVGGLREGDHVFVRGTQVGSIKSTHLERNHVFVRTDLDMPVEFREGYKIEIVASSMLGGKLMKIYEGPLDGDPIPAGEAILGEPPIDILDELGIAVTGIRGMADEVAAGEGTLGKFLKDEDMYDQLRGIMENLNQVSGRLTSGEGMIGKLLAKDDRLYDDLQASAANLKSISDKINQGDGTLGRLLAKDDPLYDDLQASAANLRSVSEKVNQGGGTLGKLVEDDQLYDEAQKLLEELRAAIDDMRETSPVTTFSTILFGAF